MWLPFSTFRLVALVATAFTAPALLASDRVYPVKPIQIIVPFPGGGVMDVATRVVLNAAGKAMGQQFVVENKPGASGNIGTQAAAKAQADGYNLLMGAAVNTVINSFMYPKLGFDLDKDFVPVAQFGNSANIIYVHPSVPAGNLKQLIALLKESPDKYMYASPGNGTTPHLAMEMLKAQQQMTIRHVPFKGSPAATTAVVANELEVGVDAIAPTLALIKAGKIKAIAVTGGQRFAGLPNVPTVRESGVQLDIPSTYLGIFAPVSISPAIVTRLAGEVEKSVNKPEVQKQLEQLGITPEYREPSKFKARINQERPLWREAVKASGAKVD